MKLQDVAGSWDRCPQKPCKPRKRLTLAQVVRWASAWDRMVHHVMKMNRTVLAARDTDLGFLDGWAGEVLAYGRRAARQVLTNLERIRKKADITLEMAERWNSVLLPFIRASESALRKALGIAP